MNNMRRKQLEGISSKLSDILNDLELIKEEEEEYLSNIPDNLRGSERYQISEAAIDNLATALDQVDEAIMAIDSASE